MSLPNVFFQMCNDRLFVSQLSLVQMSVDKLSFGQIYVDEMSVGQCHFSGQMYIVQINVG